jgi:endonuclease/exonuclease/phosphatase (EEP) superfamily protein YafD
MARWIACAVAAPWVAWALVRTLGLDVRHPLVAAMAYTPYAAALAPLPVLAGLLLRRWVVAGVAGLAAAALALAVVPRAVGGPQPEVAEGPTLVVMTANLYEGQGDAAAVMKLVRERQVDVLSVQELTPGALGRLHAAGAAELLPGHAEDPRPGGAGSALLARRPVRPTGARDVAGAAQPQVTLGVPGAPPVRVKAVHPPRPIGHATERVWRRAMRAMPGSDGRGDVQILAGDFNATLDHRELRRLLDRGYVDAGDAAGEGLVWTWPALRRRRALPVTIDHVLVDRRVRVRRVRVERIPGSDHRAVIAELALPAA